MARKEKKEVNTPKEITQKLQKNVEKRQKIRTPALEEEPNNRLFYFSSYCDILKT
jgi:hypothetical protein